MKNSLGMWVMGAALAVSAAAPARADYNDYKANMNKKEIHQDNVKLATAAQKQEFWKDWVDFSRKKYDETLKKYGPNSDLTKEAKDWNDKALKELQDAGQDMHDAQKDLSTDRQDLDKSRR